MKRIIGVSIIALLLVVSFIGIKGYDTLNGNAIFYDNMIAINVTPDADILGDSTPLEHLNTVAKSYGVYVTKYVFRNDHTVSAYSTDVSFAGKIKLKSGLFPASEHEYIANGNWDNIQPVGVFHYFDPASKVLIFPFENLARMGGFDGVFHINATDMGTAQSIVSYLNSHVGPTELFHVYDTTVLSDLIPLLETSVENSLVLLIMGLVCGLVFILTVIRYAVAQSRTAAILQINGFSLWKTIHYHIHQLRAVLAFSFFGSSAAVALVILRVYDSYYLADFMIANALCFCGLALLLLLVLTAAIAVQSAAYSRVQMIKRAKPFRLLSAVQLGLKYGIFAFMLFSLVLIRQYQSELAVQSANDDVWRQAENVYEIMSRYIPEDLTIGHEYNIRAHEVYNDWEENLNGFLIDAGNFGKLLSGEYVYEANTANRDSVHTPSGKSITVNENYLRRHPVTSAETGTDVLNEIIHEPNTENILVPASLRPYEDEIRANFLEGFAFQKIVIGNKYNHALGLPDMALTSNDLAIHIIYVEDGLEYFTYNLDIEPEKQNQVSDPIVIVDIGNVDDSYYLSYLTRVCLYESSNIEPLADLIPYAAKHQMQSFYDSVRPIYTDRAQGIQETVQKLQDTIVVEALLILGFILSIYLYNACYYEKNKYSLNIKRLHGYGFFRLNGKMVLSNLVLSLAVALPFDVALSTKIALLLLDMLFTIVFGSYIGQKSSLNIIKGEH